MITEGTMAVSNEFGIIPSASQSNGPIHMSNIIKSPNSSIAVEDLIKTVVSASTVATYNRKGCHSGMIHTDDLDASLVSLMFIINAADHNKRLFLSDSKRPILISEGMEFSMLAKRCHDE
jgi:hypothetical protein